MKDELVGELERWETSPAYSPEVRELAVRTVKKIARQPITEATANEVVR
jgi:hypothetical protein